MNWLQSTDNKFHGFRVSDKLMQIVGPEIAACGYQLGIGETAIHSKCTKRGISLETLCHSCCDTINRIN